MKKAPHTENNLDAIRSKQHARDVENAKMLERVLSEFIRVAERITYGDDGITIEKLNGTVTVKPRNYDSDVREILILLKKKAVQAVSDFRDAILNDSPETISNYAQSRAMHAEAFATHTRTILHTDGASARIFASVYEDALFAKDFTSGASAEVMSGKKYA